MHREIPDGSIRQLPKFRAAASHPEDVFPPPQGAGDLSLSASDRVAARNPCAVPRNEPPGEGRRAHDVSHFHYAGPRGSIATPCRAGNGELAPVGAAPGKSGREGKERLGETGISRPMDFPLLRGSLEIPRLMSRGRCPLPGPERGLGLGGGQSLLERQRVCDALALDAIRRSPSLGEEPRVHHGDEPLRLRGEEFTPTHHGPVAALGEIKP